MRLTAFLFLSLAFLTRCAPDPGPEKQLILGTVPVLDIFEQQLGEVTRTFVTISVPGIDEVAVDLWCYEDDFGRPVRVERQDGMMILYHEQAGNTLETVLQPEPGGVAITGTLRGENGSSLQKFLNLCATYQRSQVFGNKKHNFDESYLEDFVGRAFLFLDRGRVYLSETERVPSVDPRENPFSEKGRAPRPWVQEYVPSWLNHDEFVNTFYGKRPLSPDRPVLPLLGVVSQDRRFLSAIAWPDCERLGQLFLSCLHPNPRILDTCNSGTGECVTRGKIYFMENNPERLLEQFKRDFPDQEFPPVGADG